VFYMTTRHASTACAPVLIQFYVILSEVRNGNAAPRQARREFYNCVASWGAKNRRDEFVAGGEDIKQCAEAEVHNLCSNKKASKLLRELAERGELFNTKMIRYLRG
jgi:hypothetical protein